MTLTATQAGNSSFAPLTEVTSITVNTVVADTPVLPTWGLVFLAGLFVMVGSRLMPASRLNESFR